MRLSVIIPAHNEENHIKEVVEDLQSEFLKEKIDFEIIVVNDNSKDGTGRIADDLAKEYKDMRVIHRAGKNGFGRAVRDGLAGATGDCVILVMADKSDDPRDVVKIFRKLEEGYDVVYGCRFIHGAKVHNYPFIKLIINRLANHFLMALFLIRENDITNAFKGYNMRVIKALWPLNAEHFNITAELPLRAYTNGFSKVAVPVRWYGRESGVSKLSIIRMGQRYLRTVLRIWIMWVCRLEHRRRSDNVAIEDVHWEEYWEEKEDSTLLGRILFKVREMFWVDTFVRFAEEMSKKGRVLEAGSGSALSSIYLSKRRADRITALDISSAALSKAKECAHRAGVGINVVKGDLYRLPFSDRAFDMVWNSGTMEHFADPVPILKEMGRVGDTMICIVPAKGFAFEFLGYVSGFFGRKFKRYFLREDEIFYSEKSLAAVLRKAGFEEVRTRKIYCIKLFPYIAVYGKKQQNK